MTTPENPTPATPPLPWVKYALRLGPVVVLWFVLVGWLAWLINTQANRGLEADRADVREWLDEARNFRKTLPELVRDYVALMEEDPPGPEYDTRLKTKADELAEHMRSLAEPTQVYTGQLPLFPEVYKLEVSFPGLRPPAGRKADPIVWESSLPRPRQETTTRVRELEYNPLAGGDRRAVVRCEYRLHAFNKYQRDRQEARSAQLLAASLLVAASVLALVFVVRFLRKERDREVRQYREQVAAEHRERDLLEARVKQKETERESEELGRKLLEQERDAARLESRAAEAEKAALEMKSQLYASIGIMAGSYAHNIKNLLVRPNDLLTRCIEVDGLSPDQEGMLHEVKTTLGTVTERLQQILRTVRRDPARAEMTRIDLNELVCQTRRTWAEMGREKWKLRISAEPGDGPLCVRGDLSHLQQAVENLLFNARDATFEMRNHLREEARRPPGADNLARRQKLLEAAAWKGEVVLRTRHEGGAAVLEVQDNGIGMTEEVRENCLRTHFTTKRDNALYEGLSAGMGLGLSFVAVVLEHHGAALEIDSAPLRGTTFRVRLPLAGEEQAVSTG
jgi:signal transduction histidine kinase